MAGRSQPSRPEMLAAMESDLLRLRAQRGARKRAAGLSQPATLDTPVGQQETMPGATSTSTRRTAAGDAVVEVFAEAAASATQGELAALQRNEKVRTRTVVLQSEIAALRSRQQVRKLAWRAGGEAVLAQRGCPVRSQNAASRHIAPDAAAVDGLAPGDEEATNKAIEQLSRLLLAAEVDAAEVLQTMAPQDRLANPREAVEARLAGRVKHPPPPVPTRLPNGPMQAPPPSSFWAPQTMALPGDGLASAAPQFVAPAFAPPPAVAGSDQQQSSRSNVATPTISEAALRSDAGIQEMPSAASSTAAPARLQVEPSPEASVRSPAKGVQLKGIPPPAPPLSVVKPAAPYVSLAEGMPSGLTVS